MKNLETMLCIGGPLAGQRKEILYGSSFWVAQLEQPLPNLAALYLSPDAPVAVEHIRYQRKTVSTPEGNISFWAPEGVTALESLTLILETYMETNQDNDH